MALKNEGIRMTTKTFLKDGKVLRFSSYSKRRIFYRFQAIPAAEAKKYSIYVNYMIPGKKILNEGVYTRKKDAVFALKVFTDKQEIEFVKNYWEGK